MARVLVVVAPTQFRDEEVFEVREELQKAGHEVGIASTTLGTCTGMLGGSVEASETLTSVHPEEWEAVVFVGGTGARALFNDKNATRLAKAFYGAGRLTTGISSGPVVLANASLLDGRRATAASTDIRAIENRGARYQKIAVITDGMVVTASGPAEARIFGKELVRQIAHREAISQARPPAASPPV